MVFDGYDPVTRLISREKIKDRDTKTALGSRDDRYASENNEKTIGIGTRPSFLLHAADWQNNYVVCAGQLMNIRCILWQSAFDDTIDICSYVIGVSVHARTRVNKLTK